MPSWVVGRTTERVLAHAVAVAARTRHELLFSSELTLPPSAREDSREELAHAAVLRTDLVLDEFSWTVMGSASPQLVTDLPGGGLEVWDTAVERSALRARLLPQLVPFWAEHVNGLRAQGRLR